MSRLSDLRAQEMVCQEALLYLREKLARAEAELRPTRDDLNRLKGELNEVQREIISELQQAVNRKESAA